MLKLSSQNDANNLLDINNNKNISLSDDESNLVIELEVELKVTYYNQYTDKEDLYVVLHPVKSTKLFDKSFLYPYLVTSKGSNVELLDITDNEVLDYLNSLLSE